MKCSLKENATLVSHLLSSFHSSQQTFGPLLWAKLTARDERLHLPSGTAHSDRGQPDPSLLLHPHSSSHWRIWYCGLSGDMGFRGTQVLKASFFSGNCRMKSRRTIRVWSSRLEQPHIDLETEQRWLPSADTPPRPPRDWSSVLGRPGLPPAEPGKYPWLEQLERLPEPVQNLLNRTHFPELWFWLRGF